LDGPNQVGKLVERGPVAIEAAADFAFGGGLFVADVFDEHLDAVSGGHFAEMETEGEDDAGGAVTAPEEEAE
jgi:hypothetical protein